MIHIRNFVSRGVHLYIYIVCCLRVVSVYMIGVEGVLANICLCIIYRELFDGFVSGVFRDKCSSGGWSICTCWNLIRFFFVCIWSVEVVLVFFFKLNLVFSMHHFTHCYQFRLYVEMFSFFIYGSIPHRFLFSFFDWSLVETPSRQSL